MNSNKTINLGGLLTLYLSIFLSSTLAAQDNSESLQISLNDSKIIDVQQRDLDVEIKIDGKIDEAAWQDITSFERMKVSKPDTLKDPIYKSIVRFFYTVDGFYFSVEMEQPKNLSLIHI